MPWTRHSCVICGYDPIAHLEAHDDRVLGGQQNLDLLLAQHFGDLISEGAVWPQVAQQALAKRYGPADESCLAVPFTGRVKRHALPCQVTRAVQDHAP